MDSELLKILSEELRETKNLVIETRRMADAAWEEVRQNARQVEAVGKQAEAAGKQAEAAGRQAEAANKKADAAWELVVMTRNQIQEELRYMRMPWWKKIFPMNS